MNQYAAEVETLIFGSSHAWFGINPAYFDGLTFNLSFMSQSPKYDCFLLEKWGDSYKNLKTIVVPISYFTFFFDEPFGVPQVAAYYRIYMDCPYHSWLSTAGLEMALFKALHGKLITQKENQWKVLCDEYGWHAEPFVQKDDDFADLNHLNSVGSEKFTKIMIHDMQLNN